MANWTFTVLNTATTLFKPISDTDTVRSNIVLTNISDTEIYISFGEDAVLEKWVLLKAGSSMSLSRQVEQGLISAKISAICSVTSKKISYTVI